MSNINIICSVHSATPPLSSGGRVVNESVSQSRDPGFELSWWHVNDSGYNTSTGWVFLAVDTEMIYLSYDNLFHSRVDQGLS